MTRFHPEEIWIEAGEEGSETARTVCRRAAGVPVHRFVETTEIPARDFALAKRRLVLQRHRGAFLRSCPAGTPGLVCCNYLVINLASNCPMDCSYCFLQDYLARNTNLKAFTNVDQALDEVGRVLAAHPQRSFRIGTGELADSLALDPLTGLSRILVPYFARFPNALLELKTKTDCIDDLLALDPRDRVVVSWSVNAPSVVAHDERGTATLDERLDAARRVQSAGYRVGFHLDPLIHFPGWEEEYEELIERLFAAVPSDRLAWVSLGSLRLTPQLAGVVGRRGQARRTLAGELVACEDGKARVWHGLRIRMYRFAVERIRRRAPQTTLYLCMEPPAVWERVMRDVPTDRALGLRLAEGGAG